MEDQTFLTYDKLMAYAGTPGRREIIEKILSLIRQGKIPMEGKFPSERKLSTLLNLSRPSLRLALRTLIELQLIYKKPKSNRWYVRIPQHLISFQPAVVAVVTPIREIVNLSPREIGGNYLLDVHTGVIHYLQTSNYHILILLPSELRTVHADWINQVGVKGIVLLECPEIPTYLTMFEECKSHGIPIAAGGDEPWAQSYDRAVHNHREGCQQLVHWLYHKGCRRILRVCWGPTNYVWQMERNQGYKEAIQELCLPELPIINLNLPHVSQLEAEISLKTSDLGEKIAWIALKMKDQLASFLIGENQVDAVLVDTDSHAFFINFLATQYGRHPHQDFWVGGYDAYAPWIPEAKLFPSFLPTVSIDKKNQDIGTKICQLLEERIKDPLLPVRCCYMPPHLVNFM